MEIRVACPDDWPAMRHAFVAAGRVAWPHILGAEALAALDPPSRWEESLRSGDVVVAERDGTIVGFAIIRPSPDEPGVGELDGLYTHPSVWGEGAGRALLGEAVKELARRGFREATLWTAELNNRPRRVYEAAGWRLDTATRERNLRGSEFVEVRYRKRL